MVVENYQITGGVFRKFSGDVLLEVVWSLSDLHAYTVDIAVINDIAEQMVDIVTATLMLNRTSAPCALDALPANNVVEDVHVDRIKI